MSEFMPTSAASSKVTAKLGDSSSQAGRMALPSVDEPQVDIPAGEDDLDDAALGVASASAMHGVF